MHRAYQPILPCGSKYLQQKWDKTAYEGHKKKILMAKPVVDTSAPPTYGHLHLKLRKLKLDKDRLSTIERDNYFLLKKISYIMKTEGRIDNKNEYKAKSLNREKREQELFRIHQENCAILERIAKCESWYSVQKWNEDWQKTENYMSSITRYPQGLCKLQIQKEQHKKMHKKRLKNNRLKDGHLTDKQEEGIELIHQNKELNEDHQGENRVEKA
ncbi:uncharacterized protein LOC103054320 [Python bivittatus]|uniref:Uncharacterized protein LOC103054320 n=1 Tax=Python bivittatus TaxID=176946 RepID=A0A9F2Q433_PYTBI|nr:uncharacterized protein LOC103054320 [Python bivittatus]